MQENQYFKRHSKQFYFKQIRGYYLFIVLFDSIFSLIFMFIYLFEDLRTFFYGFKKRFQYYSVILAIYIYLIKMYCM